MSGQVIEQLPEGGLRLRILEVDRPFPKQGQPEISQERLEAAGNGVNDTAEHGRARADNGISLASELLSVKESRHPLHYVLHGERLIGRIERTNKLRDAVSGGSSVARVEDLTLIRYSINRRRHLRPSDTEAP
jgi:hypothetical protein